MLTNTSGHIAMLTSTGISPVKTAVAYTSMNIDMRILETPAIRVRLPRCTYLSF